MINTMFKKIIIQLINSEKEHLDLKFHIRQTDLAQKWASLVKNNLPYGIRENERFTGFYEDPQIGIDRSVNKVISLISNLKPLHPEIDFGQLDFSDAQSEVNRIHTHFADRHLVKKDLTNKSFQYWNDLNVVLHQIESYSHAQIESYSHAIKYGSKENVLNVADITVTFYNKNNHELTDKDYENAVLNRTFGNIYIQYAQVGRHIMELYWSQDDDLPTEHIQLFKKFNSDFFLYLGPSFGHHHHLFTLHKMKEWFQKKKKYFSKMGLSWDPKKLGIGRFPVAFLEDNIHSLSEIKALRRKISKFQKVESIEII